MTPCRAARAGAVLGAVLAVAGCASFLVGGASPPTDLSVVAIGTPRTKVEHTLGKPINVRKSSAGLVLTYSYNKGLPGAVGTVEGFVESYWRSTKLSCEIEPHGGCELAQAALLPFADVSATREALDAQEGEIDVTYGADDTVLDWCVARDPRTLFGRFEADRYRAAADDFRSGKARKRDLVRAYKFYTLAHALAGHPLVERDAMAEEMTTAEIAEAERLAAEAKPPEEALAQGRFSQDWALCERSLATPAAASGIDD